MGAVLYEAGPKGWQVVPGPYSRRISALKRLWCRCAGGRLPENQDPQGIKIKGWQLFWWRDTLGNDLNCRSSTTTILQTAFVNKHLLRYSVNGRAGIGSWRFLNALT